MYRSRGRQKSFFDDALLFGGVALDLDNEWVKLAEAMPWDALEKEYITSLTGASVGNPAKPARMALGTLYIKKRYRFSNVNTIKEIQMNPYLQHFIGLAEFTHKAIFDARSISNFKKRASKEILIKMDEYAADVKKQINQKKEG